MDLDELERHLPKDNLEPLVLGTSETLAINVSNKLCLFFFDGESVQVGPDNRLEKCKGSVMTWEMECKRYQKGLDDVELC